MYNSEEIPSWSKKKSLYNIYVRKESMEYKFPKSVAVGVSFCCGLFIFAHLVWPKIEINNQLLILIGIGMLPWLTFFVKKFKLPGGVEAETHERSQSTTEKPAPPANESEYSELSASELSPDAKKIIATLWRYQNQHFGNDKSKRWTFIVSPIAPLYSGYLRGASELFDKGLIAFANDHHIMLTNEGLYFMEKNVDALQNIDLYRF